MTWLPKRPTSPSATPGSNPIRPTAAERMWSSSARPCWQTLVAEAIDAGRLDLSAVDSAFVVETQAAGFRQRRGGAGLPAGLAAFRIRPRNALRRSEGLACTADAGLLAAQRDQRKQSPCLSGLPEP